MRKPNTGNFNLLNLEFTREQDDKFVRMLDILYDKGYNNELKYKKDVVGDALFQYSIVRVDPKIENPKYGDILVKMILQGGKCELTLETADKQPIQIKEILNLPNFES